MTSLDFAALMREERKRRKDAATASSTPQAALLAERSPLELERHRVGTRQGLEDIFYVPNFLTQQEASTLQEAALGLDGGSTWAALPGRRLLNLGGVPHSSGMFAEPLPSFAAAVAVALTQAAVFERDAAPDQFLINEYFESQGIDAHRDGPLYKPKAAILSLGSPALLDFLAAAGPAPENGRLGLAPREAISEGRLLRRLASVALEPNSLLLFSGRAYTDLWHGIASGAGHDEIDELCINRDVVQLGSSWQRGYRMSFTVRKAAAVVERPATAEGEAEARRRHAHWLRSVADNRGRERQLEGAGLGGAADASAGKAEATADQQAPAAEAQAE